MLLVVYTILFSVPLLAILWWIWAHRRLRTLPQAGWWRAAVAVFSLTFLGCYAWMMASRSMGTGWSPHPWLLAMLMLWGMIFLPFVAIPSAAGWYLWRGVRRFGLALRRLKRGKRTMKPEAADRAESTRTDGPAATSDQLVDQSMTRRQLIAASCIAFPMVATLGTTVYSIPQKRRFTVRTIEVPIPDLPRALDGTRIAHISDTHVGKFTRGPILDQIAHETSRLDADLVVMTGDLIDHTVQDLPEALEMIDKIKTRNPVVTIEGNHDLFDGRSVFRRMVREHGVSLLLDESRIVWINDYPVQLLGIKWHDRQHPIDQHVDIVAERIDRDAFPVLLAHHPHAFDRARDHDIPLTLAGHTHGGQLMLSSEFGAGPAIFKYWSGLYTKDNNSLVVSNGAGNWFPLRTNAPAEIVHVILRRS
ncbi:MAG: hypothetical protein EA377_08290 [Phycisphaerales bacterium]|nr:MAG: hypothetical protein EA377_08290 [Phycisphaerales bacterium]